MKQNNTQTQILSFSFFIIFFIIGADLKAQHVGIGTTSPQYNLDLRTRLDTTLSIFTNGNLIVQSTTATRLGILNVMNDVTQGNRLGMLTSIDFPNSTGDYTLIGHQVEFGFCGLPPPLGNCVDESEIYGYKVDIPLFTNSGPQFGFHAVVPSSSGYAGYFDGRGFFGKQSGIGTAPTVDDQLSVFNQATQRRGIRLHMSPIEGSVMEGLFINGGSSSDETYGMRITLPTSGTNIYGISSAVNKYEGGGNSHGVYVNNVSTSGIRYGVTAEITGASGSSMFGLRSVISGNSSNLPSWAIYGRVDAGTATASSFGIQAINNNVGPGHYAGYFDGKTKVQGALHIGPTSNSTIPSGYYLAVDGRAIFEEVRVELSQNWPDYVFEDSYHRLTIDELHSFIQEKGHLPNIPSASEVEQNGIHLGDMDRRLLEKIEELTLYIIDQNEKIKALENRINNCSNEK